MADELRSYPIPNLVQGVSQQTPQQRRDTQCQEQFDCINSPVNGCEARPHFDFIKLLEIGDVSKAFTYEIFRGDDEHYLVLINKTAIGGHKLKVYDLRTGNECTVTYTASEDYLNTTLDPRDSMSAVTLEDYTFIANRAVKPAIDDTTAPAAVNEAIVFVKQGSYSVTYQLQITYDGNIYSWDYTTPDNSTVGNAPYVNTSQIAATFFRGLTGVAADSVPEGGGTIYAGDEDLNGDTTAVSLGFTISLNGNVIRIRRADDDPFSVDVNDGAGSTYFRAIKDQAQSFNDLPKNCFVGFTTKVKGSNRQTEDDYWVQYKGHDGVDGYWEEVVKPGTKLEPDALTMPHALVNTGENTFEWKTIDWGNRIAGDGVNSSPDPEFIGKEIRDLFYDNGRLGILTEGSATWSRARNPYVFFPDTAQTILDTDPVDIKVGGGKTIALLRRAVQVDEAIFLWAPKVQFRISSGSDPFKQDTVESKKSTSFEFAEKVAPQQVADSLYFATEPGAWATIRDLTIKEGKPRGFTDVTGHVKKYIRSGLRILTGSDTLGLLFAYSTGSPNRLYAYNFLLGENDRIQSAWNTWRLPEDSEFVWVSVSQNYLYALIQRDDGAMIARMDLSIDLTDNDEGADYLTRLDFRVTDADCTFEYDPDDNETKITLPYALSEFDGYVDATGYRTPVLVVNASDSDDYVRGRQWPVKSIGPDYVVVSGDAREQQLYIGCRITAEYLFSRFHLKNESGAIHVDRLDIKDIIVAYANTGYFEARVTYTNSDQVHVYPMTSRTLGDPSNLVGRIPITDGNFKVPINRVANEVSIRLVNDTFLPSRWTTANYSYVAAALAKPAGGGTSRRPSR